MRALSGCGHLCPVLLCPSEATPACPGAVTLALLTLSGCGHPCCAYPNQVATPLSAASRRMSHVSCVARGASRRGPDRSPPLHSVSHCLLSPCLPYFGWGLFSQRGESDDHPWAPGDRRCIGLPGLGLGIGLLLGYPAVPCSRSTAVSQPANRLPPASRTRAGLSHGPLSSPRHRAHL